MPIDELTVGNFKGLADKTTIRVRPLTIFVGANSSGKSSCIHALACLSQTVKISADRRPLVLDDEVASVHLGRFIEVIHSKSYQDEITLGLTIRNADILDFDTPREAEQASNDLRHEKVPISCKYRFKCSKRTQEVTLENAEVEIGDKTTFELRGVGSKYNLSFANHPEKLSYQRQDLQLDGFFMGTPTMLALRNQSLLNRWLLLDQAQSEIKQALVKTFYLGPFRQPPSRRYASRGASPEEVGAMGESTITMLANESIQSKKRPHLTQIASWLAHLGLGKELEVGRIGSSDLFNVALTLKDGNKFSLADLGYGISQVLPVLTQCTFSPPGSTLLFEQPELHVHPLAAKKLAKIFIDTAMKKSSHICIETHSPELIGAFIASIRDNVVSRSDVAIYKVARHAEKTRLEEIKVDEYGETETEWRRDLAFE